MIQHNKVLEKAAPQCLTAGAIRIGTVKNKENSQMIYYSMDKEIKRLGRVLLGSMGSGKSYYLRNLAKDIIKDNRGLVVIDYIDKCQLSESIKAVTPKEKLIEINIDNKNELQAFNFNELNLTSLLKNSSYLSKFGSGESKYNLFSLYLIKILYPHSTDNFCSSNELLNPPLIPCSLHGLYAIIIDGPLCFSASMKHLIVCIGLAPKQTDAT